MTDRTFTMSQSDLSELVSAMSTAGALVRVILMDQEIREEMGLAMQMSITQSYDSFQKFGPYFASFLDPELKKRLIEDVGGDTEQFNNLFLNNQTPN